MCLKFLTEKPTSTHKQHEGRVARKGYRGKGKWGSVRVHACNNCLSLILTSAIV